MKKGLAIVAVVGLYSCLETVFLLSFLFPTVFSFPSTYQAFVGWSQLVVIPGIAALFSRLMYGSQGWRRRAINTLLLGSFGLALFLTVFFSVIAEMVWSASVHWTLFIASAVILGGGFIVGIAWTIKRIQHRSVALEEARWLNDKQRQITATDRRWRNRGIRIALWIPSLTALLVGTFLVPIWGALSHVAQPRPGNLGGFHVPIPLTAVVLYCNQDPTTGHEWATLMRGHGSPLLSIFCPSKVLRLSSWGFHVAVSKDPSKTAIWRPPEHEQITGQRQFQVGRESVECFEYTPAYMRERKDLDYSSIIYVNCDGLGRFSASFGGEKTDLPAFYEMLADTKQLN